MTPEELLNRIEELEREINLLKSAATIPYENEQALRERLQVSSFVTSLPNGFEDAPLASITAPSGGATVDSQARTAISTIITRLEDLGLVSP